MVQLTFNYVSKNSFGNPYWNVGENVNANIYETSGLYLGKTGVIVVNVLENGTRNIYIRFNL